MVMIFCLYLIFFKKISRRYSVLKVPGNSLRWNKIIRVFTVLPRFTRTSTSFHIYDNFYKKTIIYFSVGLMGFRKRKLKHLPGVVYTFYGFFIFFFKYHKAILYSKFKRLFLKKNKRKVTNLGSFMKEKPLFYNIFSSFKFFCKFLDIKKNLIYISL